MKFYYDIFRHLICLPYSIKNLHLMADELQIKRCWFHKNHYDIPKRRIKEIQSKCTRVNSNFILDVIYKKMKNNKYE